MSISRARRYFEAAGFRLSRIDAQGNDRGWILESLTWKPSSSSHTTLADLCRWWKVEASQLIGQAAYIASKAREWADWPPDSFDELDSWAAGSGSGPISGYMLEVEGHSWHAHAELAQGWVAHAATLSHHRRSTMTIDDLVSAVGRAQRLRLAHRCPEAGIASARTRL